MEAIICHFEKYGMDDDEEFEFSFLKLRNKINSIFWLVLDFTAWIDLQTEDEAEEIILMEEVEVVVVVINKI